MAGFFSEGAIMCTSYLPDRSLEIALPVVLDSMTTVAPSGTFSMNSATPCMVVLKTNVSDGAEEHRVIIAEDTGRAALLVRVYPYSRCHLLSLHFLFCFVVVVSWIQDRPSSRPYLEAQAGWSLR